MVESQSFVDLHDCTCVRSCSVHEDGPRWGLGPGPVLLLSLLLYITLYIYIYIVIIYFFYVIGTFKNLRRSFSFFSLISLTSLTQLATIQSKNNKNIHNSDCILAKKKKKLFYYQRTKKLCVIGEVKTKFFAIKVNWYKYHLTVARY